MEKEELSEQFRQYKPGEVLKIHWDGRNGELNRKNVYYGINPFNHTPLLIDVENLKQKPVIFFDVVNPEIRITKIERTLLSE